MNFSRISNAVATFRKEHGISVENFFNPESLKYAILKWTSIVLILVSGLCLSAYCIVDIIAYEKACNNPVLVDAQISVEIENAPLSFELRYIEYLSYEYGGVKYEGIVLKSHKEWATYALSNDGKTVSVAINPNDPSQLVQYMVNDFLNTISLVILSVGLAFLVYGILIENDRIWNWRVSRASKSAFSTVQPDYFKDSVILILFFATLLCFICNFTFPNTF